MTSDVQPQDAATSPALRELRDLVGSGGWRPLPGSPGALIFIRSWPDGSVDTLALRGEDAALTERTDPSGKPVWHRENSLIEIIAQLRELPAPDAADAPRSAMTP